MSAWTSKDRWIKGVFPLWMMALGSLWELEEPSTFATMGVMVITYAAGLALIRWAHRSGVVASEWAWVSAWVVKITLVFLMAKYFWALPLGPDRLRTFHQGDAFQDANVYDYDGLQLALKGFWIDPSELSNIWQSFGVVRYIAVIYQVFGVSTLYVAMGNVLVSLAGFLALTGLLTLCDPKAREWEWMRFGLLLPLLMYYDATPSKEPLTYAFFYLSLYGLCRVIVEGKSVSPGVWWGWGASLSALLLIRPNAVFLLMLIGPTIAFWRFRRRIRPRMVMGALAIAFVGIMVAMRVSEFVAVNLSMDRRLAQYEEMLEKHGGHIESNPLKAAVVKVLMPKSLAGLVGWAPVRTAVWLFTPYPLVELGERDWHLFLHSKTLPPEISIAFTSDLMARLGIWVFIGLSCAMAAGLFQRSCRASPPYPMLLASFSVTALVLGNSLIIMNRRYRVLVEPLMLAFALIGFRYGTPIRSFWWVPLVAVAGVLVVGLVR